MESTMKECPTVIFAGGGTGGHLYPALAIADEVKRLCKETRIVFIGTAGKIEARVVPRTGYTFETIWISGFRRALSWSLVLFPLKVCVSLVQTLKIVRRWRPDVVVGTGGYVSGPPVFIASLLGIPAILQEQNSVPGATTRLLAKRAREIFISLESSRRYLPGTANVILSGNPVRSSVGTAQRAPAARFFNLDANKTTILVFGGSLGASSINGAVMEFLPSIRGTEIQVIWQTGEHDLAMAQEAVQRLNDAERERVRVAAFIERMDLAFGASDIAVCRAGASTLAELALAGVPAILVPYPHAAADHQTENARAMVDKGAAVLCPDREVQTKLKIQLLDLLQNGEKRNQMSEQMRSMAHPEAAATIAAAVIRLSQRSHD